jgi:hypothetical protein
MPFKLAGRAPRYTEAAISGRSLRVAVGVPDILLMILAALSLWALIFWAASRYL